MSERTLIVRVRPDEGQPGGLLIESPAVGMADRPPRAGVYLNPLDRVLSLTVLNRRFVLRLPRDASGTVTEVLLPDALTPVAYGQPIARLDPRALAAGPEEGAGRPGGDAAAGEGEGWIGVPSPSDGIFYRRPAPDAEPFVETGSRVAPGSVLGMVEVMKSFNAITYGGPGLPDRGEVVEILAEDAQEVAFGQILFRIRGLSD